MTRRLVVLLAVLALLGMARLAYTAANTMPGKTRVGETTTPQDTDDRKPSQCSSMPIGNRIESNDAIVTGTLGADLILGGSTGQTISGSDGNDCIHGGGGDDTISGGLGDDVIIGGDGHDTCSGATTTYGCEA